MRSFHQHRVPALHCSQLQAPCMCLGGQAGLDGPAGHSTTQVLLKRRAWRNVSCQICLMPNLPHACSTCLETLASELSRQDAASPATTGDPPPLLRPKSQAGWPSRGSCSCGSQCGREMRASTHYVPSHPGITQTLQAPALELKCNTTVATRCKTGQSHLISTNIKLRKSCVLLLRHRNVWGWALRPWLPAH